MTINRDEVRAGAEAARKTLNKVEREGAVKTPEQRRADWLKEVAEEREAQEGSDLQQIEGRVNIEVTRRDLQTPGNGYALGAKRYAADGTLWRREA